MVFFAARVLDEKSRRVIDKAPFKFKGSAAAHDDRT